MKLVKSILLSLVALLFCQGANAQMEAAKQVANEFTLVGTIKGAGNSKVTLEKIGTPGVYASAVAKNDKFTLLKCKGSLPHPFKLTIGDKSMYIALENGRATIVGDINDLQNAKASGLSSHDDLMELLAELKKCKTESEKDTAKEVFMSKNSHSWISVYCLEDLAKRYIDNTQKMRSLLSYVSHFKGGKNYDAIEKKVAEIEASEE